MKQLIILPIVIASVIAITGCLKEEISPETPTYHIISARLEGSGTKAVLQEIQNSYDLTAKWQGHEYIYVFYRMTDSYHKGDPLKVQVAEITPDGSGATFTYRVPAEWDKSDVYKVKMFTSPCNPKLVDGKIYYNASLSREPLSEFQLPVYSEGEINAEGKLSTSFHHYRAYELLHMQNTSDSDIEFSLLGFEGTPWYKEKGSLCLEDGSFLVDAPSTRNPIKESPSITIKPGESQIIVSSYVPNGGTIQTARLVAKINGEYVKTSNTKSSSVVIRPGHAYHMYAGWDGKNLKFWSDEEEPLNVELLSASFDSNLLRGSFTGAATNGSIEGLKAGFMVWRKDDPEGFVDYDATHREGNTFSLSLSYKDFVYIAGDSSVAGVYNVSAFVDDAKGNRNHGEIYEFTIDKERPGPVNPSVGEFVDLGLTVKWATCNIGASSPRDVGDYFAWGEYWSKADYSWANYDHSANANTDMKKYNGTDNLQAVDADEDVVHVWYGGNWRMPTLSELNDLKTKCTWEEIKEDDVLVCYKIVSKINNNYIYLPVSGYKNGTELKDEHRAHYWTGTRNDNAYPHKARALSEVHFTTYHDGDDRYLGMPVRGVYDDSAAGLTRAEYVDLGLGVKWASCNIGASAPEYTGDRFAWGSTVASTGPFTWAAYSFSSNGSATMMTYNGTDNLQYLKREDDVVYLYHKDARWRTPTLEEWQDLKEKCTWTPSTLNGRRGYLITSPVTNNSIFLPIAGLVDNMQLKDGMSPRYWSATRNDNAYPHKARALNEVHFTTYHDGDDRCLGMPVRGVYDETFTRNMLTSGEMVDLGLTVKWATRNLGATVPEEAGKYYAWGEQSDKSSFSWENYRFSPKDNAEMSTYNGTDNVQYLKREDDISYISHTGNSDAFWRTPTIEEWQELKTKCTWEFKLLNGRRGYKITSKTNGNSIFLPIAGLIDGVQIKDGMSPRYWSSTRNDNAYPHKARALNEVHFTTYHDGDDRYLGMTVRAVYDDSFKQKTLTSGELVDMGLSVKWASHNVGSTLPEETGDYYAWGELTPKTNFSWGNYRFSQDGGTSMSKYHGTDNLQQLEREDDIVYQQNKGKWRIPTKAHWDELWKNCDQEIVRKNGRRGYLLTSKINGNSIFLPIAGLIDGSQPKDGMTPRYWSSTRNDNSYSHKARALNEVHFTTYHDGDDRYLGMPLRAIYDDSIDDLTTGELVDLGLSVKWATTNMGASSPEETGDYYAWGELKAKDEYTWATYEHSADKTANMAKYHGTDNLQYLDCNDDVVHKYYGGDWRMPTIEEWRELKEKCTWTEQVQNGRKVYKITSSINGKYIFLPIAGLIDGKQRKDGMSARYWSITRNDNSYPHKARALNEVHFTTYHDGDDRYLGMPVRGVYDDSATKMLTDGSFIDMGLSVKWASHNYGVSRPEYCGNYYAWGELRGKITYTWATYRFSADDSTEMSKYNSQDNYQLLDLNDDVIKRESGGASRMPTINEWFELRDNCDWIFKIKNGRPGYVLVSKKNKNTIFLPVVGYIDNEQVKDGITPHYWSATRNDNSYPHKARALNERHFTTYHDGDDRYLGMPIRAVKD